MSFGKEVQAKVDKLLTESDRRLFKVLVAYGWNRTFVLLSHQPEAVRFVTGVDASWPSEYPPKKRAAPF